MTNAIANDLLEKDLQKQVINVAKRMGYRVYHTWTAINSPRGLPDLVLCKPPRLIFLELKREKGRNSVAGIDRRGRRVPAVVNGVSEDQQAWIDDLAACPGVVAVVIRPSDWFAGKVEELLTNPQAEQEV